ncbi:hypothetical protein CLOM_g1222 [Closterium sp. NIES-68]|nr:hypothetical protein CLOM_g1222 [Closterium sp. NIES-68]GJP71431.1 hypothetical protein CLOP_g2257 [Closterium sp. NIES-67]
MPQRHSRNSNDRAHFTYEERRKLGFGTQKERLGKDSIKPFDSCSLCIQEAVDPLSCRSGHIFCKECIYSCLLAQKKDIKRKRAAWEAQQRQEQEEEGERAAAERARELDTFDRQNHAALAPSAGGSGGGGSAVSAAAAGSADAPSALKRLRATPPGAAATPGAIVAAGAAATPAAAGGEAPSLAGPGSASGGASGRMNFQGANSVKTTAFEEEAVRTMRAYWLPSATPGAPKKVDPPPTDTTCPEGCGKLRLKDLFPIVFTKLPPPDQPLGFDGGSGGGSGGGSAKQVTTSAAVSNGAARYMCPACSTTLTNASKLSAIAACGHVLCRRCIEKFVSADRACTVCGAAVDGDGAAGAAGGAGTKGERRGLVQLACGGTGYAGHGDGLVAKAFKPLGSGPAAGPPIKPTRLL